MNEFSILETEILIPFLKLIKDIIYHPLTLVMGIILIFVYIYKKYKQIHKNAYINYDTQDPLELFINFIKHKLIKELVIAIFFIAICLIIVEIFVFNKYNI